MVDTILVGDGPQGIAVTPDGSYAYVANVLDDTVSVINPFSNCPADFESGINDYVMVKSQLKLVQIICSGRVSRQRYRNSF